ncbi:MAG TPA: 2-amino-4-hydroxy-6-hydroxymethyldihydropteridine diphosphokinase [Oceanospirillaceae bacterium]|nr:2-amino-4-hydroxy-6-hydroxymethyldihydropteridine diphosphokinase [Oceanospirillaceae bacterium]
MTVQVYLGLGANIDPEHCLRAGVAALRDAFGESSPVQLSPVYQTQAVGLEGPDFLNMVVGFSTLMSVADLRAWIKEVENKNGRQRDQKQSSCHRLDMDLLLYGNLISPADNLPRSDVLQRAYVLKPLADIAPALSYPGAQESMASLWQASQLGQVIKSIPMEFTD